MTTITPIPQLLYPPPAQAPASGDVERLERWPLARLRPNEQNPRGPVDPDDSAIQELAASIRAQRLLQPLLITPDGTVVAGHRRLAAARLAGLHEVPVTVRELSEREQLESMLAENMARQDLSPLQEARAFRRLLDGDGGHAPRSLQEVARRVGVTPNTVKERVALLTFPPEVQVWFDRRALPLGLARLLSTIPDPARQVELARLAAEEGLTVGQLMALVERGKRLGPGAPRTGGSGDAPRASGPEREAALHRLLDRPGEAVTFGRLFRVVDALCCACGAHTATPEVCRTCPLPKLIQLVTARPAELAALAGGRPA
ncbi:MAG: ParB/RepB/Spo0J family partition protein [Chloroflexota bacterium]